MTKSKLDRIAKKAAETVARRHAASDAAEHAANKVVDSPSPLVVDSSSTVTVNPSLVGEAKMRTLTRINHNRKGSNIVFSLGNGRSVKFPRTAFGVVVPETLPDSVAEWPLSSGSTPKAKLTKEERAALRAAETPAQKLEKARAAAARQAAKIAKLEAAATSSM